MERGIDTLVFLGRRRWREAPLSFGSAAGASISATACNQELQFAFAHVSRRAVLERLLQATGAQRQQRGAARQRVHHYEVKPFRSPIGEQDHRGFAGHR
jgi:hypothetical protein